MDNQIQQKQIVLNNLLVTYYTYSAAQDAKNLLFLHGWRSNSLLWAKVLPPLIQKGYNIYCLDFPGFGKSQLPSIPFRIDDYADIVKKCIEKLDLQNITLIGHSHGGRVSIKIASKNPEFLQALVLVDAAGIHVESSSLKIKKYIAKLTKPLFLPSFMQPMRKKIYQMMGAEDYMATPEQQKTFLNIINEDLTSLLPYIHTKTLILWGEKDSDTPVEFAQIMQQKITNSELHVIPQAGHYSFLDQPVEFVKFLSQFLEKI